MKLTAKEKAERAQLERLNQADAAALIGITPRQLRNLECAPRNVDGSYHAQALILFRLLQAARGEI